MLSTRESSVEAFLYIKALEGESEISFTEYSHCEFENFLNTRRDICRGQSGIAPDLPWFWRRKLISGKIK